VTTNSFIQWHSDALGRAVNDDKKSKSPYSSTLIKMYRFKRLRGLVQKLCFRLESSRFHSQTWRAILKKYYDMEIGKYSYGPILYPRSVPRGTVFGAYCSIGKGLIVVRRNRPVDKPWMHPFFFNSKLGYLSQDLVHLNADNPLIVGNDVWIGDRVTILAGCKSIGNGAVIAAGAVVTADVAPYEIVGGIPAKPLKKRFDEEEIAQIEATKWWEKDISDIIREQTQ